MSGDALGVIIIAIIAVVMAGSFALSFAITYSIAKYIKARVNRILFGAFGCGISAYIFAFGITGANNASAELTIKKTIINRDAKSNGA